MEFDMQTRLGRMERNKGKCATDFARNFLVTLLTIVLGLGALEFTLRVSPDRKPWPRTQVGQFPNLSTSLMADPLIGWGFRLNWESDDLLYRSNSLGFRGRDFDPSPSTRKIILVGDSFAFGQGVPEHVSYSVAWLRGPPQTGPTCNLNVCP
jgi:hypothetical protein